jgi:hypothetical protein
MSPASPRICCNLTALVCKPPRDSALAGDLQVAALLGARSAAPLCVLLERRSSSEFLAPLLAKLQADGLPEQTAAGCLHTVITRPTVAVNRSAPGGTELLQAVIVDGPGAVGSDLLVVFRASVERSKPPHVTKATVDLTPLDVDVDADLCHLAEYLESWWREYKVREVSAGRRAGMPRSWAWLGNPLSCGYSEVPADWEAQIRAVGSVLGMQTFIAKSPVEARAETLDQRSDLVVRLCGGYNRDDAEQVTDQARGVLTVGRPGSTFADLLRATRAALIPLVVAPPENPAAPRELMAGETVYHRKIGDNKRYDVFDQGSREPCIHGANSYTPWSSAAKATKGMERRYTNFREDGLQLLHCRHYPNCGMYAVRRRERPD